MATEKDLPEYKLCYWEEVLQQTLTEDLKLFLQSRIETMEPVDHFAILNWEQGERSYFPQSYL